MTLNSWHTQLLLTLSNCELTDHSRPSTVLYSSTNLVIDCRLRPRHLRLEVQHWHDNGKRQNVTCTILPNLSVHIQILWFNNHSHAITFALSHVYLQSATVASTPSMINKGINLDKVCNHPLPFVALALLAYGVTHPLDHSSVGPLAHWVTHPSGHSPIGSLTPWITHPSGHSPLRLLTQWVTHPLTRASCQLIFSIYHS